MGIPGPSCPEHSEAKEEEEEKGGKVERIEAGGRAPREGIDLGDSFETVISPFIKFYGLPSTDSHCFRECRSRASPRFSMACDLITEIVLIIVDERRKEGRGVERGERREVFRQGVTCRALYVKRTAC